MTKNSMVGYYILTGVMLLGLVYMLASKRPETMYYYFILMIWWPAKTAQVVLEKRGKYTKNNEAWLGVLFIIIFWIFVGFLGYATGLPAM